MAILINLLVLMAVMTVPYWIGKRLGSDKMVQLIRKYPIIQSILSSQEDNQMVFCVMLRACAILPADIVTMYLGATGMPYFTNLIGGVPGNFPGMVLTIFLDSSIRDPESPAFWQSLILNVLWILLSGLVFYLYKKVHSGKEEAV